MACNRNFSASTNPKNKLNQMPKISYSNCYQEYGNLKQNM